MLEKEYKQLDEKALDEPLDKLDKEIKKEYNDRIDLLSQDIQALYDEYEDDNGDIQYELLIGTLLFNNFKKSVKEQITSLETVKNDNINILFNKIYETSYNGSKDILQEVADEKQKAIISNNKLDDEIKDETIDQRLGGASTSERLERDKNDTIFRVNQKVENSIQEGKTYTQTRKELKGAMETDYNGYMTIAETKGHTIAESSKEILALGLASQGLQQVKIWNTVGDEKVRKSHKDANGQEAALDEPFIVQGEELMYPGDPKGSPSNILNCRCYLSYELR